LRSSDEEVFEEEREDRKEPGLRVGKRVALAQPTRGVPNSFSFRSLVMTAPNFCAALVAGRKPKIASGPVEKVKEWDGPARPPRTGENRRLSSQTHEDARMLPFADGGGTIG
jgi:hypothetical protein